MADQTRKPKPKKDDESARTDEQKKSDEVAAEVDELLDEIDEVLESNAEDFVRSYVQKGGQALQRVIERLQPVITSQPATI